MKTFSRKKERFFLFTLLLMLLFACGKGQENEQKEPPINLSTSKLPIEFKGDDIGGVYGKLMFKKPDPKGQYETTEEYKKRINSYFDSLNQDDTVYFFQETVKLSYDADKEKYSSSIVVRHMGKLGELYYSDISSETEQRTYTAQNAFGTKVEVTLRKESKYSIIIVNRKDMLKSGAEFREPGERETYSVRRMGIEIPMPVNKAKQSSLRMLAVCRPKPSGSPEGFSFGRVEGYNTSPTFNNPNEWQSRHYYIYSELLGVWIYDFNTGEILAKFSPPFFD